MNADAKSVANFINMGSQELDDWFQWQGTFGLEAPIGDQKNTVASSTYGSGHWSTNLEDIGEDVVDPSFSSYNYFLFDDPSFLLRDPGISWQFSPVPTVELNIQSLQGAANKSHRGQRSSAKTESPTLEDAVTPKFLPGQFKVISTTSQHTSPNPSRSQKQKQEAQVILSRGAKPKAR
jgi:hypothetical protein